MCYKDISLTQHACIRYEERVAQGDSEEELKKKVAEALEHGLTAKDIPKGRSWDEVRNYLNDGRVYYKRLVYVIQNNTLISLFEAPERYLGDLEFALAKKGKPQ